VPSSVDVLDELRWDPGVNAAAVGATVKDGVVTLEGTVDSFAEKWAAERAAKRLPGVKALAVALKVKLPGSSERTDADIARAAENALKWDVLIPHDRIKVTAEKGFLTLEGEVDWQFQKSAAERATLHLTGVAEDHFLHGFFRPFASDFGVRALGSGGVRCRAHPAPRTEFGMSEKLGSVRYAGQRLQYLGGATGDDSQISPETRQVIDGEVQRIATEQYVRAQAFLREHRAALEALAQQLLKQETVDGGAVKQALRQGIG
jgi:osmotically-inducible protein OsmY